MAISIAISSLLSGKLSSMRSPIDMDPMPAASAFAIALHGDGAA